MGTETTSTSDGACAPVMFTVRRVYQQHTWSGSFSDIREVLLGMLDEEYSQGDIAVTTSIDEMSKRITWPGTVFELERDHG